MSRPSKMTVPGGRLVQAHEAAPERRLAAAGLADEAERLARAHLEADAVDRLHARDLAPDHAAARDREVLRDVARLEQERSSLMPRSSGWIVVSRRARFSASRQVAAVAVAGRGARARAAAARPAGLERVRAARRERAAGRQREQRRRQAGDRRQPVRPRAVEARDRAEQAPGVRVLRVREELVLRARPRRSCRRTSRTTRSATSATTPMSCVISMTAEPKSRRSVADQLEDLRLDRHVERRRRLVGDQEVGVARERHRDHHALAHAARELVRVVVDAHARLGDADRVEQLDRAPRAPPPSTSPRARAPARRSASRRV